MEKTKKYVNDIKKKFKRGDYKISSSTILVIAVAIVLIGFFIVYGSIQGISNYINNITNSESNYYEEEIIVIDDSLCIATLDEFSETNTTDSISEINLLDDIYLGYHLNETSGTTAYDISDKSNDGACANIEDSDWLSGKLNNSLNLDGVDEYISLSNSYGNFERTDEFSIESWIKTNSTNGYNTIVGKTDMTGSERNGYSFSILGGGNVNMVLANDVAGGSNIIQVYTVGSFNDGLWHHVIMTYDGSSDANGVNIYVDGNDESLNVIYDTLTLTIQNTRILFIGARDATNFFNGTLDEVIIYDKTLDQQEVAFRYNGGVGRETFREDVFYKKEIEFVYEFGDSWTKIDHIIANFTIDLNSTIDITEYQDNGFLIWSVADQEWKDDYNHVFLNDSSYYFEISSTSEYLKKSLFGSVSWITFKVQLSNSNDDFSYSFDNVVAGWNLT